MELNIEAFLDGEWDALRNMFSHEDADFMLQTNADHDFFTNNDYDGGLILQTHSIFWPPVNDEGNNNQNVGIWDANSQCLNNLDLYNFNNNVSQESSNNSNASEFDPFCKDNFLNNLEDVLGGCLMQEQNSNFLDLGNNNVHCQPLNIVAHSDDEHLMKRKYSDTPETHLHAEFDERSVCVSLENPAKKPRVSRNASKRKTNVQPNPKLSMTKAKKLNNTDENEIDNALKNLGHGPNNSYSSSEDDYCKVSKESNGGETSTNKGSDLNLKGKKRSTRGSATDPQSLYARKRRERINERLRILQNLIPNGTKVDISTMLEEAVHYVKFMQLQIKLLSSDDMWMYAPIVYNGMDMGILGKHLLV